MRAIIDWLDGLFLVVVGDVDVIRTVGTAAFRKEASHECAATTDAAAGG
jgi:hypothetical protein